ncbi:transporting ATPase [Pseudidiomarina aquimaris]|uniref:Transporting ATPase n=1 Tax=Pseudidiomarina aquimaris TaxID=641841 RepID=A0A432XQL6_9GAMM|nr:elongation factor P hydroxylase [Pseudidiomarina aquimaris]RUO51007.1 transporting ATPase [Pseudidiomarina aquimaris]
MCSHHYSTLIELFHQCFYHEFRTELVAGDDEPLYRPASDATGTHQIIFAHGFFASALHEIAHWCIAGEQRRQLEDYGYWYEPDGRNAAQQAQFEQVERKPQALEWLFARCAGIPFQVSIDNLGGIDVDRAAFTDAVHQQLCTYLAKGVPPRAERFARALAAHYQQPWPQLDLVRAERLQTRQLQGVA